MFVVFIWKSEKNIEIAKLVVFRKNCRSEGANLRWKWANLRWIWANLRWNGLNLRWKRANLRWNFSWFFAFSMKSHSFVTFVTIHAFFSKNHDLLLKCMTKYDYVCFFKICVKNQLAMLVFNDFWTNHVEFHWKVCFSIGFYMFLYIEKCWWMLH